MAAFCHLRSRALPDTLVDLLLDLIHRIGAQAERKVDKALLDDLKRADRKNKRHFAPAPAAPSPALPAGGGVRPVAAQKGLLFFLSILANCSPHLTRV